MRVGSLCVGRSGDKGSTLNLTWVALNDEAYVLLEAQLTTARVQEVIGAVMPGEVTRYPVPGLRALKFVIDGALPGGVYATLHAGSHWQKAATWVLLDLELESSSNDARVFAG